MNAPRHDWSGRAAGRTRLGLIISLILVSAVLVGWALVSGDEVTVAPPAHWEGGTPASSAVLRTFVTADSVTIEATQYSQPSRGTLIVLHGLGPHESALAAIVSTLTPRIPYHALGMTLRGQTDSSAGPGAVPRAARADDFTLDIAAAVHEVKRREPSGPVILVGSGFGAALAVRYLAASRFSEGPRADAVVLIEPRFEAAALATAAPTWSTSLRLRPRRRQVATWLMRLRIPGADRLPVAWPATGADDRPARPFTAGQLAAITVSDPWAELRRAEVPVLVLTAVPPTSTDFPPSDEHRVVRVPSGPSPSDEAMAALTEFFAPFAEAAAPRAPVRATTTVPVLPGR